MPYYKDKDENIYHLDEESNLYMLPEGIVPISDIDAEAIINPVISPNEYATKKKSQFVTLCEIDIDKIRSGYPDSEVSSWSKQETEANAYISNQSVHTPLLSAIAAARGISVSDLAQRVVVKADSFAALAGEIIGHRQKLDDRIDAIINDPLMTNNDKLAAIDAIVW